MRSRARHNSVVAKFGARVFLMDDKVLLVSQTIKRGSAQNAPYVIDQNSTERFIELSDDKAIAEAIRDALQGKFRKA
jgi:hypothetical protein